MKIEVRSLPFDRPRLLSRSLWELFPGRDDWGHVVEHLVERACRAFIVVNAHLGSGGSARKGMNTDRVLCDRI